MVPWQHVRIAARCDAIGSPTSTIPTLPHAAPMACHPGQTGTTPLVVAGLNGRLEVVRALLAAGADKDASAKVWVGGLRFLSLMD